MSEGIAEPTVIPRRSLVVIALGIVALLLAGIVLSCSWFIAFPPGVLDAAWSVALVGAVTATAVGWRSARRADVGFFRSIKEALRALGQFIFFFF